MSSSYSRRFSDSQVHRSNLFPEIDSSVEPEGAFETIGYQLELEGQLHKLFQQLLQSYKETQQWAFVGQLAQGLITSSQRVGKLRQQLEGIGEGLGTPFLKSIRERSLPRENAVDQSTSEQDLKKVDPFEVASSDLEVCAIPAKPDTPPERGRSQLAAEQPSFVEPSSSSLIPDAAPALFPVISESYQDQLGVTADRLINSEKVVDPGDKRNSWVEQLVSEEKLDVLIGELEQPITKKGEENVESGVTGPIDVFGEKSHTPPPDDDVNTDNLFVAIGTKVDHPEAGVELDNREIIQQSLGLVSPSERVVSPVSGQAELNSQQTITTQLTVESPGSAQISTEDDLVPTTSISSIEKEFGIVDGYLDDLTSEIEALVIASELSSETSDQFFSPPESITLEPECDSVVLQEQSEAKEPVKPAAVLADSEEVVVNTQQEQPSEAEELVKPAAVLTDPVEVLEEEDDNRQGGENPVITCEASEEEPKEETGDISDSRPRNTIPSPTVAESNQFAHSDGETDLSTDSVAAIAAAATAGVPNNQTEQEGMEQTEGNLAVKYSVKKSLCPTSSDGNKLGTTVYLIDAVKRENGQIESSVTSEPIVHGLEDFVELHRQLLSLENAPNDGDGVRDVPHLDLDSCLLDNFAQENGTSCEENGGPQVDNKSQILETFLNQVASCPHLQSEPVVVKFLTRTATGSTVASSVAAEDIQGSSTPLVNGGGPQEPALEEEGDVNRTCDVALGEDLSTEQGTYKCSMCQLSI